MSREDKENERVALDYVTRGIFVPQILVTLVFVRLPPPSSLPPTSRPLVSVNNPGLKLTH